MQILEGKERERERERFEDDEFGLSLLKGDDSEVMG